MFRLDLSLFLIVFLPLINFGPWNGAKLTYTHILSFLIIILLVYRGRFNFRHPSIVPLILFISSILVSSIIPLYFSIPQQINLTQFANYLFMLGVMLASYNLANISPESGRYMIFKFFQFGLIFVSVSLFFYIIGFFKPSFIYWIASFFNNANTFDLGSISAEFNLESLPRLSGFSPEPSFWSIYIAVLIATGLSLGYTVISMPIFILLVALGCTFARTGIIAILIFFIYLLFRYRPLITVFFLIMVIPLLIVSISFSELTSIDLSVEQRFESVYRGITIFIDNPLLGLGWGGFKQYSIQNQYDYPVIFNYYVQVAADGGLFVLFFLFFFLLTVFYQTNKKYRGILLVIFIVWVSAPAYNLPYIWFFFGILPALKVEKN